MNSTSRHLQYARGYIELGMVNEAKKHLNRSIKLDESFKAEAVEDEDLAGLWDWLGSEKSK